MKVFTTVLCFCAAFGQLSGSAIPMWEYLSKDEKMSYLYSMFANQVEDFCDQTTMKNCNQELLKHGLGKLKVMPEDHLDTMDPYQRGAHTLIWDSMMEGHAMMNPVNKHKITLTQVRRTTAKPNSYNDQSFGHDYQTAASAKIDNVYRVAPPKGFAFAHPQYTIASGPSQYKQQPKPAKFYPSAVDPMEQSVDEEAAALTGPMVVRVHLDGTPVRGAAQLPHDEDLRQYQMSKARLPNL